MGSKALLAVVCWLSISQALGDKGSVTTSAAVKDNESSASTSRLYRNVPLGVYASAAPYASYSFQLPQFIAAPKTAASQVAPVKQKPVNTFLMDSYGNRYFEGPQQAAYKAAFPQQYVSLQSKLPEHLAQPLVAASPNFQFKQSAPQVFFGAPFRVPALQSPTPTPLNQFPSFEHLVYAHNVQSLAPSSNPHHFGFRPTQAQQQSTNSKAVYSNTNTHEKYSTRINEPKFERQQDLTQIIVGKPKFQKGQESSSVRHGEAKFQRIQEIPRGSHGEVKFQHLQENPHSEHSEAKFQSHRSQEKPHGVHGESNKYELLQEAPQIVHVEHTYDGDDEAPSHQRGNTYKANNDKAQLQSGPGKQTTITYVNNINGKTSVVKVQSEPLPLLDLTLLEPLTFANPLVPQVQHFLPRINQATYQKLPQADIDAAKNYQKEFVVQNTMAYDSGNIGEKPQKQTHKKKEKKPTHSNKHPKKNDAPKKTTGPHHETLDDVPEIVYEINMPGHKETIQEKRISYNKETQSEPVHYSYGSKSEKDPVTYSYSRSSKEPLKVKDVHYHGNGRGPQHLIYKFKPEEQISEEHEHNSEPHSDPESHNHSHDSEDGDPGYHHNYKEHPKSSEEHHEPTHNEQGHDDGLNHGHHAHAHNDGGHHQEPSHGHHAHAHNEGGHHQGPSHGHHAHAHNEGGHHHGPSHGHHDESSHSGPNKYYSTPTQHPAHYNIQPTSAQIKVDPNQHVQNAKPQEHERSEEHEQSQGQEHESPQQDEQFHAEHQSSQQKESHNSPPPQSESKSPPITHVHEKSKRIIIHEEAPDERHMHEEQMKAQVLDMEENNEEDFEKAYKNAAVGFPAYSKQALEAAEKDIFDPESYGVLPDHDYSIDHTPFQQYQEEGDEFPKAARSSYQNSKDNMKENYYTDYAVNKPESLLNRYENKLDYYKLYEQQKPDYYVANEDENKKKQEPKFAKYSAAPTFGYPSAKEKKETSYYGHHKPKQQLYEYDYSNGAPRDSSAYASRPYQRYKSNFVEPQFQYGFEPVSIPKLLDSELAAMESNHRPESEKPGMRKKVYKENWYIKKTRTAAGAPAS